MKSLVVHYMNKYHGGQVRETDMSLDVYDSEGRHCVALRKDGSGQMVCRSEELGCEHKHDLSPIPKDARLWKMDKLSGKIVKDEKHAERKTLAEKFSKDGKIQSCEELMLAGMKFDEQQKLKTAE